MEGCSAARKSPSPGGRGAQENLHRSPGGRGEADPHRSPVGRGAQRPSERRAMMQSNGYQSGFGNEFATEAIASTLPVGRNSPQRVAHGLYAEQLSGTAFTAPRSHNRRTWLYRIRPAAMHGAFAPYLHSHFHSDFGDRPITPDQLRWSPLPISASSGGAAPVDFVDGLFTMAG